MPLKNAISPHFNLVHSTPRLGFTTISPSMNMERPTIGKFDILTPLREKPINHHQVI